MAMMKTKMMLVMVAAAAAEHQIQTIVETSTFDLVRGQRRGRYAEKINTASS
jgi:hypothetical protein